MTKPKRGRSLPKPPELSAVAEKLHALLRNLPVVDPGEKMPPGMSIPDMARELAFYSSAERRPPPWDVTRRKLLGMRKYAASLLSDPFELGGLPLETRNTIVTVAHLSILKPRRTEDGRPKKLLAREVAELTAERFFWITGQRPTRRTATDEGASPGKAYGPFIDFLDAVYSILGIEASAASQAVQAVKGLKKKYPRNPPRAKRSRSLNKKYPRNP